MIDLKDLTKYEIGDLHRGPLIFYHISVKPTCVMLVPQLVLSDNLTHFSLVFLIS
jgi:hypothetical protein